MALSSFAPFGVDQVINTITQTTPVGNVGGAFGTIVKDSKGYFWKCVQSGPATGSNAAKWMVLNADSATMLMDPEVRTRTVISTDANVTWTAAQVMGGYIRRTLTATARSDTTPTAAAIVAAMPNPIVGASFYLEVQRTDAAAVALTVVGGTGVTVNGTATIAASTNRTFLVIVTTVTAGSEAVAFDSLGASTV